MVPEIVEPSLSFSSSARTADGASSMASVMADVIAHTGKNSAAFPTTENSRFM